MNQITLPAQELKQALAGLGKVIGRKTTLPVLQTIKVSRQRNGLITLQATDLNDFATYTVVGTQAALKPSGIDWLGDVPAHWELPAKIKIKLLVPSPCLMIVSPAR